MGYMGAYPGVGACLGHYGNTLLLESHDYYNSICVYIIIIIIIAYYYINSPCSFHGTKLKKVIPELCSIILTKFPQLRDLK